MKAAKSHKNLRKVNGRNPSLAHLEAYAENQYIS